MGFSIVLHHLFTGQGLPRALHSATGWSICGTYNKYLFFNFHQFLMFFETKTANFVNFQIKNGLKC